MILIGADYSNWCWLYRWPLITSSCLQRTTSWLLYQGLHELLGWGRVGGGAGGRRMWLEFIFFTGIIRSFPDSLNLQDLIKRSGEKGLIRNIPKFQNCPNCNFLNVVASVCLLIFHIQSLANVFSSRHIREGGWGAHTLNRRENVFTVLAPTDDALAGFFIINKIAITALIWSQQLVTL